jgi:hypothetical protein
MRCRSVQAGLFGDIGAENANSLAGKLKMSVSHEQGNVRLKMLQNPMYKQLVIILVPAWQWYMQFLGCL